MIVAIDRDVKSDTPGRARASAGTRTLAPDGSV